MDVFFGLFTGATVVLRGSRRNWIRATVASLALAAGGAVAKNHLPAIDPYRSQRVAAQRILQPEKAVMLGIKRTPKGLMAFGERGIVLLLEGRAWRQVMSPIDVTFTASAFSSPNDGWLIGHEGTVLRTRDGGATWALERSDPKADALLNIVFLDEKRGLIVGAHGLIYRTTDGGETWVEQRLTNEEGFDPHLHGVAVAGDRTIVVAGEKGSIFRSQDGESWEQVTFLYQGTLFGVKALSGNGVVVFGMGGHVFASDDAGGTWTALDSKTDRSLFSVLEANGELIFGGASGVVVRCSRMSFRCSSTDGKGNGAAINDLAAGDTGELVAATPRGLAVLEGE